MAQDNNVKKPFYKRWWFWVIVAVVVIGGIGSMGGSKSKTSSQKSSANSSSQSSKTASSVTGVSKSAWDKITVSDTNGDSSDQVKKLIGKPASKSTSNVEGTKVDLNTWNHVKGGEFVSAVTVGFSNGHAVSKGITGLKVKRNSKITLNQFNQIQNGMNKEAVEKIVGKPNSYSVTNLSSTPAETWEYMSDIKGSTGANFQVTFSGDSVSSMSQSNMQ